MVSLTHSHFLSFFLPLEPLLILYMVHYAYSESRDLFLAPAQSAGVDVYLTVGVLARFIAERPINFNLLCFCARRLESVPGPLTRLRTGQLEFSRAQDNDHVTKWSSTVLFTKAASTLTKSGSV